MSILADAIQPLLANGILGVGGRLAPLSLSAVVAAPTAAYALSWDGYAREVVLDFRDPQYVRAVLAADVSRLGTACLQSISVPIAEGDEKNWLPWTLIRLYYAAFYAAHTIVRLLGKGCCYLASGDVDRLSAVALATSGQAIPWRVAGGIYTCVVDTTSGALRWTKHQVQGPHEALWALFDEVLRDSGMAILSGPLPSVDAQAAFGQLDAFRNLAVPNQAVNWLSRMRNDIQYRLLHDVWHPTEIDRNARARIRRLTDRWKSDPMAIDMAGASTYGSLAQFCTACAFVIGTCRVMLLRINERNLSGARSFLSYGPLAYANAARLAL
jgi:hypothetical protein